MKPITILTAAEQVAEYLQSQVMEGEFGRTMPGAPVLAVQLGVSQKTVKAAMNILVEKGLLRNQGQGRNRAIALPESPIETSTLRAAILD